MFQEVPVMVPDGASNRPPAGRIGLFAAMAIGIGGMIGAGIFSILGVVAQASGGALWVSFAIGGLVALLSSYSYAKLGARYPSAGGAVEFLVKGFGDGVVSGGINIYLWVGYVIALALYAQGFAGYAMTFLPAGVPAYAPKALGVGAVLLFTAVNMVGAKVMGRSETVIVAIKLAILFLFAVAGLYYIKPALLSPSLWAAPEGIFFGAGVLFIGYEGFGLVANAAGDMADPKTMLPKALYLSVASVIVIYIAVSLAVVGNLDVGTMVKAKDYALAEAAKPFLGEFGFRLIAVAALFSTASAINATLFGAANVSFMIAKDGELPRMFSMQTRPNATGGLFISAALVIAFIVFFDLSAVAMMGSGAFLLVYACVHAAHLRLTAQTGGKPWIVWLALASCLIMLVVLSVYIWRHSRPAFVLMLALMPLCFGLEWGYRRLTGRVIKTRT
jgi:amino acid transporter